MNRRAAAAIIGVVLAAGVGAAACGDRTDPAGTGAAGTTSTAAPAANAFCSAAADVDVLYDEQVGLAFDSSMSKEEIDARVARFHEQVRTILDEGEPRLLALRAAAPPELAADVELVVEDGLARVRAARAAGDDPFAVLDLLPPIGQRALGAFSRVDAYTRANCGAGFGPAI